MVIIIISISGRNLPNSQNHIVLNVEDNLSLSITNGTEKNQIRLCGVDVSISQQSAVKTLVINELESVDNIVSVVFKGDKAEVFLTNKSETEKMLSEELLIKGLAKLKQDNCPNQNSLETAETIAK